MDESSVHINSIGVDDVPTTCPICWTVPRVVTVCGHAYCVECAYKLVNKNCGVCRKLIHNYYCLQPIIVEPGKIRKLRQILSDILLKRVFIVVGSTHAKKVVAMLQKHFNNVLLLQGATRRKAGQTIAKTYEKFIAVVPFNFCTTLLAKNVDRIIFMHPYIHNNPDVRSAKHYAMVQRLFVITFSVDVILCEETV